MKQSLALALLLAGAMPSAGAIAIQNLQVEYRPTPLGIDVAKPRFSWQMAATAGEQGSSQSAYQIQVRDPKGNIVWDSQRVAESRSLAIAYGGSELKPSTRYAWAVTVWDQKSVKSTANSWFETGLMNPNPDSPAWGGAKWIGGGNEDLVLYAPYLAIFKLNYALTIPAGSTRASFVYGANDPRLLDKYKNIYQVQNPRDGSYVKVELDISGVDGSAVGKAKLNVYRAGYKDSDDPAKPLKSIELATELIGIANKNAEHVFELSSTFGQIAISIDGQANITGAKEPAGQPAFPPRPQPNQVNVNPLGSGGDYITFGLLCDIGFSVDAGQTATFRDITVRNHRAPNNVLFHEDLNGSLYRGIYADAAKSGSGFAVAQGRYVLEGGSKGVFVVRDPSHNSAPMLRTTFSTQAKAVESARLYVTARGIYEMYLNGKRIGQDYYNPALTQYNVTHMYQTYDVTGLVKAGGNALGARLAEGWWSGLLSFGTIWNHFGDRQSLLAKLTITYNDGTSETIATNDRTWKYFGAGPIVYASLDYGEIYDSARERDIEGWTMTDYNDSKWKPAVVVPLQGTAFMGPDAGFMGISTTPIEYGKLALVGQIGNTAGVFRTITAKSVKEVRPGVFVYDMGQNIVGVPRIRIANGRAGGKLTLRYAEILYPDLKQYGKNIGMILTENYRAALSTDVYTMKAGAQTYQPRFTSHGFQYVEITGIDKALPPASVEGVVISSVRELSADYKSSNEKVNKLWSNLVWSNVDNFLTVPTDCPQRNERMGWSGDINVFSRTATYVSNADQFLTRHMYAMRDVQAPNGRFTDVAPVGGGFGGVLWGSAGIVVAWEAYLQYNDAALLERHYPAMAAYIDFLESTVDPKTGLSSDATLGDWLGPQNNLLGTPYLVTAYHAYDLGIMAKVAEVLGKKEDAAKYQALYEKRKAFFNQTFLNAERKTLATGSGMYFGPPPSTPPQFRLADTQTSYAVGLGMGLFNKEDVPVIAKHFADSVVRENKDDQGKVRPQYSLMTGFIGTSWISKALSENGQSELAYRLLNNEKYPSWLYPVDQGATSIWERLNSYTVEDGFGGNNSMNSFNHYSFGAVGQWMIANSLGIERGEPGFQKFVLQPEPDPTGGITWAEGYYDSMYGRIKSAWKVEGRTLTYRATVPPNTSATLYLPAPSAAAVHSNAGQFVKHEGGRSMYVLQPGSYVFTVSR